MISQNQKRAAYALKKVKAYLDSLKSEKEKKEFKSFVAGLPAMILQNGFGLTMAFLLSKQKNAETTKQKEAFNQIKEWVVKHSEITKHYFTDINGKNEDEYFLSNLNKLDQFQYRTIQQEALNLLEWIKRYAAAFVIDEGD